MNDLTLLTRFWCKATWTPNGDCFEWQGYRHPKGYGRFFWRGRSRPAHRVAFHLTHNEDPGEMHVLHKCDNPPCVNPQHLYLGTNADNVRDKVERGRVAAMPGEAHPSARLTRAQVAELRRLYAEGVSPRALGGRFGISRRHAARIIARDSWRDQ